MIFDRSLLRRLAAAAAVGCALFTCAGRAVDPAELQTVNVGRAIVTAYAFSIFEIGNEAKTWESVGLKLNVASFRGDGQLQQAMTAGAVDIGLGSGPAMGYHSKGVPATAVAAMYGAPTDMAIVIGNNGIVKSVADLKGKRLAVTTAGSLTDWLVHELSRRQGWGPDGIQSVAMGSTDARLAALQSGEIAGSVQDQGVGYALQEEGKGRVFMGFGKFVQKFYTHVIFARDDVITKNPDTVARFLKGWFRTIAWMKTHKKETVRIAASVVGSSEAVVSRLYDEDMASFSTDGSWDIASIEAVRHSLPELGITETEPDIKTMYTARFVPVKL